MIKKRSSVPEGLEIFPAVWLMKRKRHIETEEVRWKARLNFDGMMSPMNQLSPGLPQDSSSSNHY